MDKNAKPSRLIAEVKSILLDELESTFGVLTLVYVGAVGAAAEDVFSRLLVEIVATRCPAFVAGANSSERAPHIFEHEEQSYGVGAAVALTQPDVLEIAILPRSITFPKRDLRRRTLSVRGVGRFQKIRMYWPSSLSVDADAVLAVGQAIYETGYRWIFEQTTIAVGNHQVSCEHLYAILRSVIGNDSIVNSMWFVAVAEDRGFFLLDRRVVSDALYRVGSKAPLLDKNAFELVADMMSMCLPFEVMHTKIAISNGECVDIDLASSAYSVEDPELIEAEMAVYDGRKASIFPLKHESSPFLAVGFPSRNRKLVESVLVHESERLASHFTRFASRLRRLLDTLKVSKASLDASMAGELLGGAVVGVLKRLIG